jgi:hypothetical protein
VTDDHGSVEGAVDALVAEHAPGLRHPAVRRRDVVLVTGPWLAGTSSVVAQLRDRLPHITFVETTELRDGEAPLAVVFVVSAVAPLSESDCALVDAAAAHTDLVVGVVTKIDVHRNWRGVLDADRELLTAHAPRYARVPWAAVAAAPDLDEPDVDRLVEVLADRLADSQLSRRNHLQAWIFRLMSTIREHDSAAESAGRATRVATLQEHRADAQRQRRLVKSERAIALRSQIQQARVQLSYFARSRCASVRAELQEDAADMTRREMPGFPAYVERRVGEVVVEVTDGVTKHLDDVANEIGLQPYSAPPPPPAPDIGAPPLRSRGLETRLMLLLGAGFGIGVALTLSRLFIDLAPGLTAAGAVVCVLVGVTVTAWVVGMRSMLHDRALLDRWVGEVTAALRATVDQVVATRVLAAETVLTAELAEQDESDGVRLAGRLARIDAELREHAQAKARAAAERDRRLPPVQRALMAVQAQLAEFAADAGRPGGPSS